MYEYTDKIIRLLNKEFVRLFSRLRTRNLAKMDEVTLLGYTDELYNELYEIVKRLLLRLANWCYFEYWFMYHEDADESEQKKQKKHYDMDWVESYLLEYNPLTKYIFSHEVDRKKARLYESLVATEGDKKEVDTAMHLFSRMTKQYCDDITDRTVFEALKDSDFTKVMWCTEEDEKVCGECRHLDGKVFNIDEVPVKPHWNCRCWLRPIK